MATPVQTMPPVQPQTQPATPFNPKNRLLCADDLAALLSSYGVTQKPNDINIYRLALVHRSYCTRKNENFVEGNANNPGNCVCLQECSNERLEFLGDSVLGLVVAGYLYERYPDHDEGFLTTMRARLVNGQMLAKLSKRVGLSDLVLISKQIEEGGGRSNFKVLEDTFEAFLGAIYLDFGEAHGLSAARTFIISVIERYVDFAELVSKNKNHKDAFLKFFLQRYNYAPRFLEMPVVAPDSSSNNNATSAGAADAAATACTMCIRTKDGTVIGIGRGANKKAAESDASLSALKYFCVAPNE